MCDLNAALAKWLVCTLSGSVGVFFLYIFNYAIFLEFCPDSPFGYFVYGVLLCVLMCLCYGYASAHIGGKRCVHELDLKRIVPDLFSGMAIGAGSFSAITLVLYTLGLYRVNSINNCMAGIVGPLFQFLLVAIGEELLFRGILFRKFEEKFGSIIAFVVSCLAFGFSHIGNDNATLWCVLAITVSATCSAIYFYTKTLWAPIGVHWMWNFVQGNIMGLSVSGSSIKPSLFESSLCGPKMLTGGEFGPEASLITVIVNVSISFMLIHFGVRKGRFVPLKRSRI